MLGPEALPRFYQGDVPEKDECAHDASQFATQPPSENLGGQFDFGMISSQNLVKGLVSSLMTDPLEAAIA